MEAWELDGEPLVTVCNRWLVFRYEISFHVVSNQAHQAACDAALLVHGEVMHFSDNPVSIRLRCHLSIYIVIHFDYTS